MRAPRRAHLVAIAPLLLCAAAGVSHAEEDENIDSTPLAAQAVIGTGSISVNEEFSHPGETFILHGGAALFADGTTAGGFIVQEIEIDGSTRATFNLDPDVWFWIEEGEVMGFCFSFESLPPNAGQGGYDCVTLFVTDTPVKIDLDGDGRFEILMRVTLTGSN